MDKIKLVAILRGIQPAEAADHIETLINAGFRYIEIPAQLAGLAAKYSGDGASVWASGR
ncbi:2-dehydro-3-deoxy-6-phosphogalactonate aldolase [Klebsiella pneumoniae]|nr:2-dehydro-3-deoxy-6-phosphogalactonate aldolase [Klebsiella pneumoniae]